VSDEEVKTDFVVEDRLRKMMQSAKGEKSRRFGKGDIGMPNSMTGREQKHL